MSRKIKSVAQPDISSDTMLDDNLDKFELMLGRVTKSIVESFNMCIEKLVSSLDQKLSVKIDVQASEIFTVNKRVDALEKKLADLNSENSALRESIKALSTRVESTNTSNDDLEQYMRGDNLLLHGVPLPADGSKEMDIRKLVVDSLTASMPGANLLKEHISVAHRLPLPRQLPNASAARTKPPAIVIRFASREERNRILANRRLLKGKSLTLTEQLTHRRAQLLRKAGDLVAQHKLTSAWSHDGKILVKTRSNATTVIGSEVDLEQFSV